MFNRDIEHYVGNNPVKYVDPTGESAVAAVSAAFSFDLSILDPTDAAILKWGGWALAFAGAFLIDKVVEPIQMASDGYDSNTNSMGESFWLTSPGMPDPNDDNNSNKLPERISNPKHHQNSSSPEPKNVDSLYKQSIKANDGTRWAKDSDGVIHRFSKPSNGQTHWNGSTAGNKPIQTRNIPSEIKEAFNVTK